MSLKQLLLRIVQDSNYTTKGATLTWEELDDNLRLIADAIRELSSVDPGGIEPYNPAKQYSLGDLVTFQNNLWEYIYPTPSTGNAPATDSQYWEIRSAGALAHQQNTDTHTTSDRFGVGNNTNSTHKSLFARNGSGTPPEIRWNKDTGLWEYSHNGADFMRLGSAMRSATTRNGGNIELNMKGFPDALFFTDDPITTNETVQFAGVDNAIQAVWVFTIESGGSIQFPSAVKSTDVRMNAAKKWTPYDLGTYKATLIKNDADWLLDNIEGPYV